MVVVLTRDAVAQLVSLLVSQSKQLHWTHTGGGETSEAKATVVCRTNANTTRVTGGVQCWTHAKM